ncbi:hypothetical protein DPMN_114835 [Dreissena polymorpha]|uniref:Secreted protein n=1 Tax=Dreissena polymorpha TaxID=45954 RepID=A0A9D4KLR2_DREPO|nr:hypothetical protein DPMN_114835 [Dreissena polymorpha]
MYAPGNVLVFALLMQDLNRCGASMKSVWCCTCPFGACGVAVLDSLCRCSVLARVSGWPPVNFRSLKLLPLVSPKPNLPNVPDQSWYASVQTLAFQSHWKMRRSFLGTLAMTRS